MDKPAVSLIPGRDPNWDLPHVGFRDLAFVIPMFARQLPAYNSSHVDHKQSNFHSNQSL